MNSECKNLFAHLLISPKPLRHPRANRDTSKNFYNEKRNESPPRNHDSCGGNAATGHLPVHPKPNAKPWRLPVLQIWKKSLLPSFRNPGYHDRQQGRGRDRGTFSGSLKSKERASFRRCAHFVHSSSNCYKPFLDEPKYTAHPPSPQAAPHPSHRSRAPNGLPPCRGYPHGGAPAGGHPHSFAPGTQEVPGQDQQGPEANQDHKKIVDCTGASLPFSNPVHFSVRQT
jgi:hypothetical protein